MKTECQDPHQISIIAFLNFMYVWRGYVIKKKKIDDTVEIVMLLCIHPESLFSSQVLTSKIYHWLVG